MEGLNSRLSVAFDGITSTSASIELVTNKELYPQLVELLQRYIQCETPYLGMSSLLTVCILLCMVFAKDWIFSFI